MIYRPIQIDDVFLRKRQRFKENANILQHFLEQIISIFIKVLTHLTGYYISKKCCIVHQ